MIIDLDNELAEATDALINRRSVKPLTGENRELEDVLYQLCAVVDPQSPPSASFEQRLTNRLTAEWDRAHTPPTLRLLDRPLVRLASMAAAVVLVLAALIVLSVPVSAPQLQGAAVALDDAAAVLVLVGVVAVGAVAYWRGRR